MSSISMGRGRNQRPTFLVLTPEGQLVTQNIMLSKITDMDPEDALITASSLLQGVRPQRKETTIPAYECITKQKTSVTVTSVQAMEAIINNGGEFVGETTQTIRL